MHVSNLGASRSYHLDIGNSEISLCVLEIVGIILISLLH